MCASFLYQSFCIYSERSQPIITYPIEIFVVVVVVVVNIVDDVFCVTTMPQHLTTKLDALAQHDVP